MSIHVFYDNSNIWGGAHAVRAKKEPEDCVTFVQPGHYHRFVKGNREEFDLAGRAVLPLPALDKTAYFA